MTKSHRLPAHALAILALIAVLTLAGASARAAPGQAEPRSTDTFDPARVVEIVEEGERDLGGFRQSYQVVRVRITGGPDRGQETEAEFGEAFNVPRPSGFVKANRSSSFAQRRTARRSSSIATGFPGWVWCWHCSLPWRRHSRGGGA